MLFVIITAGRFNLVYSNSLSVHQYGIGLASAVSNGIVFLFEQQYDEQEIRALEISETCLTIKWLFGPQVMEIVET